MTTIISIHPQNPQPRLISKAIGLVREGAVIAYPTDSCYALGCQIGNKTGMERIRAIRQCGPDHHFTLVCRDLSDIATYAKVSNSVYRLLKALTPGPYTFLLPATREVPRRLQHPKRNTIGIRVPDHPVTQALLEALSEPLMSLTLLLPGEELPLTDAQDIASRLKGQIELVIDGGNCDLEPTTIVDLFEEFPRVVRQGKGRSPLLAEESEGA